MWCTLTIHMHNFSAFIVHVISYKHSCVSNNCPVNCDRSILHKKLSYHRGTAWCAIL